MPVRVSNTVEKNVVLLPLNPIVIPAGTTTTVAEDVILQSIEYAGRYIQNVGANDAYYTFGHDCKSNNFSGILAANTGARDVNGYNSGQQLDVSNCPQRVSVYSVGGTTIALTMLVRHDNAQGTGNVLYANQPINLLAATVAIDFGTGILQWTNYTPNPPLWAVQQTVDAGVTWTDMNIQFGSINTSGSNSGKTLRVVARNTQGGTISQPSNSVTVA